MAGRTLLCVLCLSTLNMYVCTHADTPVSAAKHNGSGSDLILNDCLAYLRFGRYWHEVAIRNAPSNVRHLGKSGTRHEQSATSHFDPKRPKADTYLLVQTGENKLAPAICCIVPRYYGVSPYMAFSRPCA